MIKLILGEYLEKICILTDWKPFETCKQLGPGKHPNRKFANSQDVVSVEVLVSPDDKILLFVRRVNDRGKQGSACIFELTRKQEVNLRNILLHIHPI